MYKHHEETIINVIERFKKRENVLALLIGGSIAHGYETETSDVDIMIIVSDEEHQERMKTGDLHYFDQEDCTYENGYIDGKYTSISFLRSVAEKGTDPARFAFSDVRVAFSKVEGLAELLKDITRYPVTAKKERIKKFYAQFEAWKWYSYEAIKHKNQYLMIHSVSNLVLFGGRLILTQNEVLYPYHKWFLRVLKDVEKRPIDLMDKIDEVIQNATGETIEAFSACVMTVMEQEDTQPNWPNQFMLDSEVNWLDKDVAVADL